MGSVTAAKTLSESAATTNNSVKVILLTLVALSFVISGSMSYFIIWINTFQLMIHLPILSVVIPGNAAMFFTILCPIATFDILGSDITTEKIFTFDYKAQEKNSEGAVTDQMDNLGYGTTNCLLCLETIGPLILIYYAKVFIWLIIVRNIDKYSSRLRDYRFLKWLYKTGLEQLFFDELISIGIQGYLELLITCVLNLRAPLFSTNGETVAMLISYHSVFITFALLPTLSVYTW